MPDAVSTTLPLICESLPSPGRSMEHKPTLCQRREKNPSAVGWRDFWESLAWTESDSPCAYLCPFNTRCCNAFTRYMIAEYWEFLQRIRKFLYIYFYICIYTHIFFKHWFNLMPAFGQKLIPCSFRWVSLMTKPLTAKQQRRENTLYPPQKTFGQTTKLKKGSMYPFPPALSLT